MPQAGVGAATISHAERATDYVRFAVAAPQFR